MSAPTVLSLSSPNSTRIYGQPFSLWAALAWDPLLMGGVPSGNVVFKDGATVLWTMPVNASGQAALSVDWLAVGTHDITAEYSGDASFDASTSALVSPLALTVTQAATTVELVTERYLQAGVPVGMAAVAYLLPAGSMRRPNGNVSLLDNGVAISTVSLGLGASGQAQFNGLTLSAGTHTLTVVYEGDINAATSTSAPVTVLVMPGTTTDVWALENAIQAWVKNALGLTTIWSSPNAPAPERPYAWLTLVGPQAVGNAQLVDATNLANPAGQEIEFTAIQHQEWELSIDLVSEMTPGNSTASYLPTAAGMLTAAALRLQLPSALAALSAAGLAAIDFGDTQDLTALFNSAIESRARMDVRLRSVNTAMEKTGYIAKVGLSSPFGTWPQLPP